MKKIVLLISAGIILALNVPAQSLVIKDKAGVDITGQSVDYICAPSTGYAFESLGLDVYNTSDAARSVKVRRYFNSVVDSSEISMCWVSCYPANVWETPDPLTIEAGSFVTNFTGDITYYSPQGTTSVKFVFFDTENAADSSFVIVNYVIGTLGIPANPADNVSLSNAYPNPASGIVNFDYKLSSDVNKARIVVTNLLGTTIQDFELGHKSGKASVDVSNLRNGIYFYSLILNNSATITRKFVVKR